MPNLGRFLQRDPIDVQDDVNLYAYVGNSPVVYVDVWGMEKTIITQAAEFGTDAFQFVADNAEALQYHA